MLTRRMSRRRALQTSGLAAGGLAVLGVAGCGDDDDDQDEAGDEERPSSEDATAAADSTAPAGDVETISFGFPFGAPFAAALPDHFVALDLGYFAEEGIDMEIAWQTALLPLITGGTVEYGRITPVNFMNALASGQTLKAIFQSEYTFFFGVMVPEDSEITEFSADQLRGTTLGITEFAGGEVPVVRALLQREGLVEGEDVELFPTSGTSQQSTVDALQTGSIAAFAGSYVDFAAIETFGLPLREITPEDVRVLSADDAIGVRADYLGENRDEAIRLCRGAAKGLIFAAENPRAAAEISLKYAPESGTVDEVQEFLEIFRTRRIEPPEGINFGEVPIDGWEGYMEFLLDGSTGRQDDPLAFDEPLDLTEVIDNSLVSEIMDFDPEPIRQQARDYETQS